MRGPAAEQERRPAWGWCNDCGGEIESGGSFTHCHNCARERDRLHSLVVARERIEAAVVEACHIIELGDYRLLVSDGPAGGQPPDLSLGEWGRLYVILKGARDAINHLRLHETPATPASPKRRRSSQSPAQTATSKKGGKQ